MIQSTPKRFRAGLPGPMPAKRAKQRQARGIANNRRPVAFGVKPVARFARGRRAIPRVATPPMMPLALEAPGLGFSLKPPKALRKAAKAVKRAVTIKNVLKAGAVVGAAALIPGALPAVAKGAIGAGKLIARGARGVGRGAVGAERLVVRGARGAVNLITGGGSKNNPSGGGVLPDLTVADLKQTADPIVAVAPAAPLPASAAPPPEPAAVAPSAGGGGGAMGPAQPEVGPEVEAPAQAGVGSSSALPLLALAGGGLLLMTMRRRRVRR